LTELLIVDFGDKDRIFQHCITNVILPVKFYVRITSL